MSNASNPVFVWFLLILLAGIGPLLNDEKRFQLGVLSDRTGIPIHLIVLSMMFFFTIVTLPFFAIPWTVAHLIGG